MVDVTRSTALHSAVIRGYEMSVKLLLNNSANTEIENKLEFAPLMLAVLSGNSALTRLLIERGANIESTRGGFTNQTVLHHAAALGHIDVINVLIEMGCDTEAVDTYGMNAAQIAAFFEVFEQLHVLSPGRFSTTPGLNRYIARCYHEISRYLSMIGICFSINFCKHSLMSDRDNCIACRRK